MSLRREQVFAAKERDDDHVFWLELIEPQEVDDLLLIRSSIPSLFKLKLVYELSLDKQYLRYDIFQQVIQTLEQLIFFLIEREENSSPQNDDALTCEGNSIVSRQKMMCDMRLIEILTDLLYYPFKNRFFCFYDKQQQLKEKENSSS